MAQFKSFGMVSYLHSIATMAVSLDVSTNTRTRQTPSHRTTAQAALLHSIARQNEAIDYEITLPVTE